MRAATYSKDPEPAGWDWFMAQLTDDRQLTVFCPHRNTMSAFYQQTGPTPPATMTVGVKGTYMAADRRTTTVEGTLEIADGQG